MKPGLTLAAAFALAACGGSAPTAPTASPDSPGGEATPDALCVSSSCGEPELLVDLPQLENVLVTSGGRLFVSGQENLYEIHRAPDGTWSGQALLPFGSGCSGLAESGAWLYALCQGDLGNGVYAVALDTPVPEPRFVYAPSGMSLPNGLVADGSVLYLTDGPVASEPKIVRLTLAPGDPLNVLAQDTWLLTAPQYPNGLAIRDRDLYTTLYEPGGGGTVVRIGIEPDGAAGIITALATRGIMDDLNIHGETLLITDWEGGAIFQLDAAGAVLQETDPGSFSQPSSVEVVGAPWFDEPTALVTERYSGNGLWRLKGIKGPGSGPGSE